MIISQYRALYVIFHFLFLFCCTFGPHFFLGILTQSLSHFNYGVPTSICADYLFFVYFFLNYYYSMWPNDKDDTALKLFSLNNLLG